MEHSPSWEVNRFSTSQEISRTLRNPKVHHRIHKSPLPVTFLIHINPVHASPFHCLKIHFNIILQTTPRCSKWSPSLTYLQQNLVYTSPPFVLHAPPISFFVTWSSEYNLRRSTDDKAPLYIVFSTPLLPVPSQAQISSSAFYSLTPSTYIHLSMCEIKFHTHTKQQAKLCFCITPPLYFWIASWKTTDSASNDSKHSQIPTSS
jgi:hypothetical protein